MTWQNFFAIAFMVAVDLLIWAVIRYYNGRGIVLAFPRVIARDRSPHWFRFHIVMLWISLALCVAFTVVVSSLLLFGQ